MAGTVNISRDIWDDTTFKDSEMSQREAWIWMIAGASWKERGRRLGSVVVELDRGQLVVSTRFLAKSWMWSEPRVRRYLDMLENRRMIQRKTDAGVTVITICKYDDYQNVKPNSDAPPTHQPTQDRRTTDANYKKGVIRGNKDSSSGEANASPKKTGTRLTADWSLPDDWRSWAISQELSEREISSQADRFKDYWLGVSGSKAVKINWEATWRNWIRSYLDRNPRTANRINSQPDIQDWYERARTM